MAVNSVLYLMLFCITVQNNHLQAYNYVKKITIILKEIRDLVDEASSSQNSKRKQTDQRSNQKRPKVFDRKEK